MSYRDEDATQACQVDRTHIMATWAQVETLPEYSTTIPTGTTPGKRWRRGDRYFLNMAGKEGPEHWVVREYGPIYEDPADGQKYLDIITRAVLWVG